MSAGLLARDQANSGLDVYAACGSNDLEEKTEIRDNVSVTRIPHRNIFWHEDYLKFSKYAFAAVKFLEGMNLIYARQFSKKIATVKPDIVHTHSLVALTPLLWREAKKHGAKVVHSLRDFDLMCAHSTRVRRGQFCVMRCARCRVLTSTKTWQDRYVDAVVGISSDILERHISEGYFSHLPPQRRYVVNNSVERDVSFEAKPRNGPIKFGFLGRISQEKGLQTLMSACRKLPAASWELLIAGKKPTDLSEFLPDQGEGMPVNWVGWMNSDAFLDQIDVLIVPSIWPEPFGRVTVEAFARNVPVLGSDIGGTPELIGNTNSDWLFPPGDVNFLAATMQKIILQGRPIAFPKLAMDKVLQETLPRVVAKRYIEIYESLASSSNI